MNDRYAKETKLRHRFVEFIPKSLEVGTLYLSLQFTTAVHLCACGCGNKVITPLSPTDWKLLFDGVSVSLYPSIGNWGFECQSHYWIRGNKIQWAMKLSREEIDRGRYMNRLYKEDYYAMLNGDLRESHIRKRVDTRKAKRSLWRRGLAYLGSLMKKTNNMK